MVNFIQQKMFQALPGWTGILVGACFFLVGECQSRHLKSADPASIANPTVSISISPKSVTIMPDQRQQLDAVVTGLGNQQPVWLVNGIAGGNSQVGTISATGLYSAPSIITRATSVAVTVASRSTTTASATASITIHNHVSIGPKSANIPIRSALSFVATLNGSNSHAVRWAVNGLPGGNSKVGTITSSGIYTAPKEIPKISVSVTATDITDPSAADSVQVYIFDPAVVQSHNRWLEGVADVANSYGCTDISIEQEETESLPDAIKRFGLTAKEGSCLVLWPVSVDPNSRRYSLAWGGQVNGKDLLYISDISQISIWNAAPITDPRGVPTQPETASFRNKSVSANTIRLSPGDDIQAAVDANPKGTNFILLPGLYRMQSVTPKNNDSFDGNGDAVLNGSQVLTFQPDSNGGGLWVADAQYDPWPYGNACLTGHPLCYAPQDLFIDNVIQTRVSSLNDLKGGTWYFDQTQNRLYLPQNPRTQIVELGMTHFAFSGNAKGVTIRNLTVEKYATYAQFGTIGAEDSPSNWNIDNVEVRWNHGTGITIGPKSTVRNSFVHHNGQKGVGCSFSNDTLWTFNEIAWNNYAGYDISWEAGGSKFYQALNLEASLNYVHDNTGSGFWTDTNNLNIVYEDNVIVNNSREGIQHEISYSTTIRNNMVLGNGRGLNAPLWGSQILLQSSSNGNVYSNFIEVQENGAGIGIMNNYRGIGIDGPWVGANNHVHDNMIIYLDNTGGGGLDSDPEDIDYAVGNLFDSNRYVVVSGGVASQRWTWFGLTDWAGFQAAGQELHGTCCN